MGLLCVRYRCSFTSRIIALHFIDLNRLHKLISRCLASCKPKRKSINVLQRVGVNILHAFILLVYFS